MEFSKKKNQKNAKLLDDLIKNSSFGKPSIEEIAEKNKMTIAEVISYKNNVMNDAEKFAEKFIDNKKDNTFEDNIIEKKANKEEEKYEEEYEEDDDEDLNDFAGHSFYQTPTDDTIKHRNIRIVWIITFIFVAVSIVLILFVPSQQTIENSKDKTDKATPIVKKESKETPRPSELASQKIEIEFYKSNVEIEYGKNYDPKTNIKSIKDQDGKNINNYKIIGRVDTRTSGEYKITVSVPTDNNKSVGKTFNVKVKEKNESISTPTPTPTPIPTPEQRKIKDQPVQQPIQHQQTQPIQRQQPVQRQVTPAQPAQKSQHSQQNQQPQAVPGEESSLDIS